MQSKSGRLIKIEKSLHIHLFAANFRSYITIYFQDGEAYAYLLNVLAPEHCTPATLDTKDPTERAKMVLEHAEKMDCKRYLTPKDIVEGSTNLNLAFVAQVFHRRYEFSAPLPSCFFLIPFPSLKNISIISGCCATFKILRI